MFARVRVVHLAELLEELLLAFLVDAEAVVGHHDAKLEFVAVILPWRLEFATDADVTVLGKLDGVADQVGDDLPEPHGVALHDIGDVVSNGVTERQVPGLRLG